jgi:methylmalonyl-CoA/ethylmalonyl-CoA epimerase
MTLFCPNTQVGAVNHIGIATTDIEASLKQYRELFNAPETEIIRSVEHGLLAAFIEQGETHIELLEPLRADTAVGRFIERHGEGIHHLAFTVEDIDAKAKELADLGIPIIDGPREGLRGRIAFSHPSATHGVLIEIVRPPEGH